MAVLHKKEEKIQAVLGRLPKKYTNEQFVEMFIKLYSKDWGKIKSAYIKQSQDKEPGTVINMPKPEVYLRQILANYLENNSTANTIEVAVEKPEPKAKKVAVKDKTEAGPKKTKTAVKEIAAEQAVEVVKKAKAPAKKKVAENDSALTEDKKTVTKTKKTSEKK